MFDEEIIRLYNEGVKNLWGDDQMVYYNHYLLGKTPVQYRYVKEAYRILLNKAKTEILKYKLLFPEIL